ncbi:MAG: GAF domain-containing protein [Anaerolineae bacterium]|nr:GAF domain-containing protein [Anaerolineae bacterium]
MFGRGSDDTKLWQQTLQALVPETDYPERMNALLAMVGELADVPACYLYLLDENQREFYLEHSWRKDDHAEAMLMASEDIEQGAGGMMQTPPLNVQRNRELEADQLLPTPVGPLYSVPLFLETEAGPAPILVGLLQIGPYVDRAVSRKTRQELAEMRFPLALTVQQAHQQEDLRQKLAVLTASSEVGRKLLGSALDLERFVKLLLDLALNATKTEAGFVAIVDAASGYLTIRAQANLPPAFVEQLDLSPDTGLFDWSLGAEGGGLLLRDFEFIQRQGARSILAVPLFDNDEPLGVFALLYFKERAKLLADENVLTLLGGFAQQIKLVIHNARLFESFTAQYLETVKGLAQSLDARSPYTQDHHAKVTAVCMAMARAMDLPPDELEAIHTACQVHDVGMAGIVEVEGGFQADFEHPTIGASLIEALPLHPMVRGTVATHHEWYDGWGFPQGLKGEEIPIGGRILAMAEFIVEMTTGNPFREPWAADKLIEELEQRHGTQFDPQVTDIALDLIRQQKLHLIQEQIKS